MGPESWHQVVQLYHAALEREPGSRAEFLAEACQGDQDLHREVVSLLAQQGGGDGVLDHPVAGLLSESPSAQLIAGSQLGPYRVERVLGAGGMGDVYLAHDSRLGRNVALKVSKEQFSALFEREARAVASLSHPNICTLFDVGPNYLVMEYIEGTAPKGPLPPEKAVEYGLQILDALDTAHKKGIVHRDLKPANILVTERGIKLLDFGLAKLQQGHQAISSEAATGTFTFTRPGAVMGTPGYMAPEQWEGRPADSRSDIYAFGCVLYEMLTGKRASEKLERVKPAALQPIIDKCLAKDPDERWQTASELRARLEEVLRRPRLRRRQVIAIAAILIVAIAGGLLWRQRILAKHLSDQDVLVLADFTNSTSDPVFDVTLRQALAIQLEQSPFLKILSDEQVRHDLTLMGRSEKERITNEIAHQVCTREGSKAMIAGSIASLGQAFAISLEATNCGNGNSIARQLTTAADREHVLAALTAAAKGIRSKLGESLSSIRKSDAAPEVTTTSLEALKAYSLGLEEEATQGSRLAGIPFYQRAIELDPNFASAYRALGTVYRNSGERGRAIENFKKAFELRDRLPENERLLFTADYYTDVIRDWNKALDASEVHARTFPRDPMAHNMLGGGYLRIGEFAKAEKEFTEAIRTEPQFVVAYANLMLTLINSDRFKEAKSVAAQTFGTKLDLYTIHGNLLRMAYIQNSSHEAQKEIQWFAGKPEEYSGLKEQAVNADVHGKRHEAAELFRKASTLAQNKGLDALAATLLTKTRKLRAWPATAARRRVT